MLETLINETWFPENCEVVKPQPETTLIEWAPKNIELGGDSEIKGKYQLDLTPHAIATFAFTDDPLVEEVVERKPAQFGGTLKYLIVHLYRAIVRGKSSLLTYADEDTAKGVLKKKLKPIIQNSPNIRREVQDIQAYSIFFKNGAHIDIAWASSAAKLATFEYPDVLADEVDKAGYYRETKEADPITNLKQRTTTFYDKKMYIISTPTTEEGNITKRLHNCDVVYDFHVPCPHCGQYQPLVFSKKYCADFKESKFRDKDGVVRTLGQVVWDGGRKATRQQIEKSAGYACGECGAIWTNAEKNGAVSRWLLVPRESIDYQPISVGIHVWRIYSLLGNSGDLTTIIWDYVDSLDDPEKLKGVINSCFAEPWKNVIVETTEHEIMKARIDLDPLTVPEQAIALTMGVDVQIDHLIFDVWAWSVDPETHLADVSWLIDYGRLPGYDELERLIFESSYRIQNSNNTMSIWRVGIDPKGGVPYGDRITSTDEAYMWICENMRRGIEIYAVLGSPRPMANKVWKGKMIEATPGKHPLRYGVRKYFLDIDQNNISLLQSLEAARIINEAKGGDEVRVKYPAFLNNAVTEEWARHITGIRAKTEPKSGARFWEKIHRHDHFDASKVARILVDFRWPEGGIRNLAGQRFTQQQPAMNFSPSSTSKRARPKSRLRQLQNDMRDRFGGRILNPYERMK